LDQGRFASIGMVEDAFLNFDTHIATHKNIRAEKKRLRDEYKALRLSLAATQRMQAAESVAQQLLALPLWSSAHYIAGYWATQGELPLHIVQMRMQAPQIWCLPMAQTDKTLKFAPWRAGDALVSNQYGIPEPDLAPTSTFDAHTLSIILLPLLAYTRTGERLGMGGGYYDRSLAFRQNKIAAPLIIGVAYSTQEADTLPCEEWDVKLDMLVNEKELLHFNKT
jgi:5-formyltetrahydrofolate cyclo-ligase